MIQQGGSKVLTLLAQLLVLVLAEQRKNYQFFPTSLVTQLTLNSCSKKLKRRNSHDSSKAVRIGSLEESATRLGLAKARYALIRERECRKESSWRDWTHSSQPQRTSCGMGSTAPRSKRILMIS